MTAPSTTVVTPIDALLLLTVLIWGGSFTVSKLLLQQMGPLAFGVVRFGMASLVLTAYAVMFGRDFGVARTDWVAIGLVGLTGVTLYQVFFAVGLQWTTATNSTLIMATSPIFSTAVAALLRQEMVAPRRIAGIVLAFVGTASLALVRTGHANLSWHSMQGDILTLLASISVGFSSPLAKPLLARYTSMKVTIVSTLLGTALLVPFAVGEFRAGVQWASDFMVWTKLAYTGILAGGIGYVFWYTGIKHLGVSRTVIYSYLIPVTGVLAAALLLGDSFTWPHLAAAIMIVGGVTLARFG